MIIKFMVKHVAFCFLFTFLSVNFCQSGIYIVPLDSSYTYDSTYLKEIQSTIIIGYLGGNYYEGIFDKLDVLGTGFFIYDDLLGTKSTYLVTNLHNLMNLKTNLFLNQIALPHKHLNFNAGKNKRKTLSLTYYPYPLLKVDKHLSFFKASFFSNIVNNEGDSIAFPIWRTLNEPFVDIALIKIDSLKFFESFDSIRISEHTFYKLSHSLFYNFVTKGDSVFTFGYPAKLLKVNTDSSKLRFRTTDILFPIRYLPVHNSGVVFQKDTIRTSYYDDKLRTYYYTFSTTISASPGQSGSPVYINKNNIKFLVGVISASYNNSISLVWPVDWIIQIILSNYDYFKSYIPENLF